MNPILPLSRRLFGLAIAAALGASLAPATSFAYDENSTAAVNVDAQGVGLRGYDPVAYFTSGAPALGQAAFSASHAGVTYHFASAANLAAFKAQPAKYAPQFGGFCAMGVSLGRKLDGDPFAWTIDEGKLYVNVDKGVQKKYLEDVKGNNRRAVQTWPDIRDKTPKALES